MGLLTIWRWMDGQSGEGGISKVMEKAMEDEFVCSDGARAGGREAYKTPGQSPVTRTAERNRAISILGNPSLPSWAGNRLSPGIQNPRSVD